MRMQQDVFLGERYIIYAKPKAEYEHFTCILIEGNYCLFRYFVSIVGCRTANVCCQTKYSPLHSCSSLQILVECYSFGMEHGCGGCIIFAKSKLDVAPSQISTISFSFRLLLATGCTASHLKWKGFFFLWNNLFQSIFITWHNLSSLGMYIKKYHIFVIQHSK